MNDEIKETNIPDNILTALEDLTNGALNYYKTPKTIELKHKLLLDYIINLHNKYENQVHRYTNLQEENERLTRFKYNIPNDKTTSVPTIVKSYKNEYEDYKSRCEKANEYIKENKDKYYHDWGEDDGGYDTYLDETEIDKLSNILNGGE